MDGDEGVISELEDDKWNGKNFVPEWQLPVALILKEAARRKKVATTYDRG